VIQNGVGYSNCTDDKQDGFACMIGLHIKIVKDVMQNFTKKGWRYPEKYHYIDTNAGDGVHPYYGDGSPILFLKAAQRQMIAHHGHFVEKSRQNAEQLKATVEELGLAQYCTIYNDDHSKAIREIVGKIPRNAFGLAYMDPNGLPSIDVLQLIAEKCPKMELLIRIPTRALKRVRNAPQCTGYSLVDLIRQIKKEYWLIRETYEHDNRFDWTFLLASNYSQKNRKTFMEWKSKRFYSLGSAEGIDILHRLNFTKAEQEEIKNLSLFVTNEAKERSGGVCEKCNSRPATEVHHLKYGNGRDPSRVIHVCHQCHCELEEVAV